MQKATISILYHSVFSHTAQLSKTIKESIESQYAVAHLIEVSEAALKIELLHSSDTIVFGSPTHFGNVSSAFQRFMEWTWSFWYQQPWKNKLAAGFTVSSTCNGDKLNTLLNLSLFAAQHGMIWISLGVLPRFINGEQTDGQNRLASYLGLMVQSNNGAEIREFHPGDILTTELFAQRILDITQQFKTIKQKNI